VIAIAAIGIAAGIAIAGLSLRNGDGNPKG